MIASIAWASSQMRTTAPQPISSSLSMRKCQKNTTYHSTKATAVVTSTNTKINGGRIMKMILTLKSSQFPFQSSTWNTIMMEDMTTFLSLKKS